MGHKISWLSKSALGTRRKRVVITITALSALFLAFQNCIGVAGSQFQVNTPSAAATANKSNGDLHAPTNSNGASNAGVIQIAGIFTNLPDAQLSGGVITIPYSVYNIGTQNNQKWMDMAAITLEAGVVAGSYSHYPNFNWQQINSSNQVTNIVKNKLFNPDMNYLGISSYAKSDIDGSQIRVFATDPSTGLSDSRTFTINVKEATVGCPAGNYVFATTDPVANSYGVPNRFVDSAGNHVLLNSNYFIQTYQGSIALNSANSGATVTRTCANANSIASALTGKNTNGSWTGDGFIFQCNNNKWTITHSNCTTPSATSATCTGYRTSGRRRICNAWSCFDGKTLTTAHTCVY